MKRILALLLALVMALSMTACGGAENAAVTTETTAAPTAAVETTAATEASHYPLTLTDQAGREVTIAEELESVVSGYYISTSALIALGQKDKLVGIEAKAEKRAIYKLSAPELIDLPNVGTAKEFDLEGCAALEPDLVILPMKLKEAAATLDGLGIPVILVNPESRELLTEAIDLMAKALNCEDAAQALFSFTQSQQANLEESLKDAEKPSVYLAGNSAFLSTAGSKMYQSDLIDLAGGVNVAAELEDTYWVEVDYEQVLAWNPDYIILASDASYTVDDVLADPNLADCAAVVNGRVYQMPSKAEAWDSPVPGGILGAAWLASRLHPETVSEESCNAVIDEFYETFYGFVYSES